MVKMLFKLKKNRIFVTIPFEKLDINEFKVSNKVSKKHNKTLF